MEPVVGRGGPARVIVWVAHLAAPLAGLWVLLAWPQLDHRWQHGPSHFWLVLAVSAVSLWLAIVINEAARRRSDARLLLVAFSFLIAAAFLGLHAVATPEVLLQGRNAGFTYASPVGLTLAAVFAAASAADLPARRSAALLRWSGPLRAALLLFVAAWAVASLTGMPPLSRVPAADEARPTFVLSVVGVLLFGLAAARYFVLYRRRRTVMLLSVVTAYTLLAEASAAMAVGRSWHAAWWEWHLLMAAGFGYVAYSAWCSIATRARPPGCSPRSAPRTPCAGCAPSTARRWRPWSTPCTSASVGSSPSSRWPPPPTGWRSVSS